MAIKKVASRKKKKNSTREKRRNSDSDEDEPSSGEGDRDISKWIREEILNQVYTKSEFQSLDNLQARDAYFILKAVKLPGVYGKDFIVTLRAYKPKYEHMLPEQIQKDWHKIVRRNIKQKNVKELVTLLKIALPVIYEDNMANNNRSTMEGLEPKSGDGKFFLEEKVRLGMMLLLPGTRKFILDEENGLFSKLRSSEIKAGFNRDMKREKVYDALALKFNEFSNCKESPFYLEYKPYFNNIFERSGKQIQRMMKVAFKDVINRLIKISKGSGVYDGKRRITLQAMMDSSLTTEDEFEPIAVMLSIVNEKKEFFNDQVKSYFLPSEVSVEIQEDFDLDYFMFTLFNQGMLKLKVPRHRSSMVLSKSQHNRLKEARKERERPNLLKFKEQKFEVIEDSESSSQSSSSESANSNKKRRRGLMKADDKYKKRIKHMRDENQEMQLDCINEKEEFKNKKQRNVTDSPVFSTFTMSSETKSTKAGVLEESMNKFIKLFKDNSERQSERQKLNSEKLFIMAQYRAKYNRLIKESKLFNFSHKKFSKLKSELEAKEQEELKKIDLSLRDLS